MRHAWIVGCGYLGFKLLGRWLEGEVSVTVMTRSTEKASRLRALGAQAVVADQGVYALPRAAPDVVVWSVGYARGESLPITRHEAWAGGLQRLCDDLARRGWAPRLIYVSTTGVYGDAAGAEIDESADTTPQTEGGHAALAAERVARGFAADAVSIRLAGIIGAGRLLQSITEIRRGLVVRAPADNWLNLVHVEDAASLIEVVARHERPPRIVNAAMRRTPTRREYYEGLALHLGAPRPRFEPGIEPATNRRVVSSIRPGLLAFRYESVDAALGSMIETDRSRE